MTEWKPVLVVRFYRTPAGAEPVREWLGTLPLGVKKVVGRDLMRVQVQWPLGRPLVGSLGGGLFEVRTSHDGQEYRVFFHVTKSGDAVIVGGTQASMVVVHGIHKKTQKTPVDVITLARKRMKESQ